MLRPPGKHIDQEELDALAPSRFETGYEGRGISPEVLRAALHHVALCQDCGSKLQKYQFLVNRSSRTGAIASLPSPSCPIDIEWYEVAAGLWPEARAFQLIAHAALCSHCGPQLRAAAALNSDPTPQEEAFLAELRPSERPRTSPVKRDPVVGFIKWLAPVLALLLIAGALSRRPSQSPNNLLALQFAEFAVRNHQQLERGELALDIHSESQQALNEWLRVKAPFRLALPDQRNGPAGEWLFHPEGARVVQLGNFPATFVAYSASGAQSSPNQMRSAVVSLTVIPDSVVVASGGAEAKFTRVSFHYAIVKDYKVVTWTLHGLTYALVSKEGNRTQRSCMVCHSAMGDRDLSGATTPLATTTNSAEPVFQ